MSIEDIFLWGIVGLNCILMIISFVICGFVIFIAVTFSTSAFCITIREYLEMFDK